MLCPNTARDRKADGASGRSPPLRVKRPEFQLQACCVTLSDPSNFSGLPFSHLSHAELAFFDAKALSPSNISESKTTRAQRRERKQEAKRKPVRKDCVVGKRKAPRVDSEPADAHRRDQGHRATVLSKVNFPHLPAELKPG